MAATADLLAADDRGDEMIERLVRDEVACAEAFDDPPDAVLYPAEEVVIRRAADERRREFRTVRHCARRALHDLGVPPAPVLPDERGMPRWPPGVVGSMTHCTGYRAAAVAHRGDLLSIGIDAEPHDTLPPDVLGHVALDEEQATLAELTAGAGELCWDRVLFSIKEAVYKAWFPLTRAWLGFTDVVVTIDLVTVQPAAGACSARLLVTGPSIVDQPVTGFSGRWLIADGLVLTAVVPDLVARPSVRSQQ